MNKNIALSVLIVAIVIAFGIYIGKTHKNTDMSVASSDQAVITQTVTDFGQKMQMVSLLAPSADVKTAMDANYSAYVVPNLLSIWEANPKAALGRSVSSPWPDRIEVSNVSQNTDGSYTVVGTVVEVVSGQSGNQTADTYPVTLTLQKINGQWQITAAMRGDYSVSVPSGTTPASSGEISVKGTYTCLPHKNTDGPQTMECALGMKTDKGLYYALDTSAVSPNPFDMATGQNISVTGTLVAQNALNSNQWNIYPIEGIIKVSKWSKQ